MKQYPDEQLAGLIEMLDAAEAEVASARRTYNRRAGSYNHHLNKLPNRLVAKPLGFDKQAGLVRFTENQNATNEQQYVGLKNKQFAEISDKQKGRLKYLFSDGL